MNQAALAVGIALSLFFACKAITWWRADGRRARLGRSVAYFTAWSGMDARGFLHGRRDRRQLDLPRALLACGSMSAGLLALAVAAAGRDRLPLVVSGGLALAGFAWLLHWGLLRLADLAWQSRGCRVRTLMSQPLEATSLVDFWSQRWNTSYSALAREAYSALARESCSARARQAYAPLRAGLDRPLARLVVFAASGLVHELAITVPALGGFGGPTSYFVLQGLATECERSRRGRALGLGHGWRGRAWLLSALVLPLPLLFPAAFLERVALPMADVVAGWLVPGPATFEPLLGLALWTAGIAHFCVLGAGVQVPHRFRWKEELSRLSRFNRRIVWAYHVFMGLTIVAFGTLTLILHDEMLRGDRAALGLAGLMASWWLLRLVVDAFWYSHDDWPSGRRFVVGHAMLVAAFAGMAGTYVSVLVAHWMHALGA